MRRRKSKRIDPFTRIVRKERELTKRKKAVALDYSINRRRLR